MRFLYQYPDIGGAEPDMLVVGAVDEVARAVEAAGFDGLSFTEHPAPSAQWLAAGGHQSLDPFVALGFAAAVTRTIRLVTFLSVVPYRNPSLLAKTATTVDKLSGGRFTLGVGTGYLKREFAALGVNFDERNQLFDEALDVLPLHWKGEPFSYEGRHFSAHDVMARPRPVQDPIPIWIGGNAQVTRRRVAERADGWMPLLGSAELSQTTRTPHLSGLDDVAAGITEIKAMAGDRAANLDFVLSYPRADLSRPERVREGLARMAEIGVTWAVVSGTTRSAPETLDFIAAFGETYLSARG